jgi:hypothetical protein
MNKKLTKNITINPIRTSPKIVSFDKSQHSKESSKITINTKKFLHALFDGSVGGDLSKYVEK